MDLDPGIPEIQETCPRKDCVTAAIASHPEILAGRAQVEEAQAAVRLAKTDIWVPDVEAFARYSYQEDVPFLARNFGTFGVHFGYDLFDSGRKHGILRERQAQLSQAKENLAKLTDAVELLVETAYNKLERTQQMLKVSQEVLALRTESNRVRQQELIRGAALNSQADTAVAQEYEAKALLLQSQMDYLQAHDELLDAMGSAPSKSFFIARRGSRIQLWERISMTFMKKQDSESQDCRRCETAKTTIPLQLGVATPLPR
jgi:outer membrane protein TolC